MTTHVLGKDDPADVAKTGFEALMSGYDHVVAGSFTNKVQPTMAHELPDTVTAEMHRKQAEPASDKSQERCERQEGAPRPVHS